MDIFDPFKKNDKMIISKPKSKSHYSLTLTHPDAPPSALPPIRDRGHATTAAAEAATLLVLPLINFPIISLHKNRKYFNWTQIGESSDSEIHFSGKLI